MSCPIKIEELKNKVPSAFSSVVNPKVSEKYTKVNTSRVINHLINMGWYPVKAYEKVATKDSRQGSQYHAIYFQNDAFKIGDDFIQVIITNSHNAENSFRILMGLYRVVCSNGLAFGDDMIEPIKITHLRSVTSQVNDALKVIADKTKEITATIGRLKSTILTEDQKIALVKQAFKFRSKKEPTEQQIKQLLEVHRKEDEGDGAWEVFNVIQENIIKGNFTYKMKKYGKNKQIIYADYKSKEIKDSARDIKINQQLFSAINQLTYQQRKVA